MLNKGFAGCELWLSLGSGVLQGRAAMVRAGCRAGAVPTDGSALVTSLLLQTCPVALLRPCRSVLTPALGQGHTSCSTVPQASSVLFLLLLKSSISITVRRETSFLSWDSKLLFLAV